METTKKCTKCKQHKLLKFYNKSSLRRLGVQSECKICVLKRRRSLNAHFRNCYMDSIKRVKNNPQYQHRQHMLTWEEWLTFKPKYEELHKKWVNSKYSLKESPSIDRIDNSKGYIFDNIQVITKGDNCSKDDKGEDNTSSKLKSYEILAIRALKMANPKLTQARLAKMFNVTRINIGNILRGITWKHLPAPILLNSYYETNS